MAINPNKPTYINPERYQPSDPSSIPPQTEPTQQKSYVQTEITKLQEKITGITQQITMVNMRAKTEELPLFNTLGNTHRQLLAQLHELQRFDVGVITATIQGTTERIIGCKDAIQKSSDPTERAKLKNQLEVDQLNLRRLNKQQQVANMAEELHKEEFLLENDREVPTEQRMKKVKSLGNKIKQALRHAARLEARAEIAKLQHEGKSGQQIRQTLSEWSKTAQAEHQQLANASDSEDILRRDWLQAKMDVLKQAQSTAAKATVGQVFTRVKDDLSDFFNRFRNS